MSRQMTHEDALELLRGPADPDIPTKDIVEAILLCAVRARYFQPYEELIAGFLGRWQTATRLAEAEKLKADIQQHFGAPAR